ncbi:alpha-L-fucosidase [Sphingobacterium sp. Lzh-3]|uniref:alpha-L-fucosidase n=1 Tax=unclassified Sphingobacterium TaxID=2609468 RepID=UPI002952988D|nr:alpha-L-fucosidase [Sphingobacterium sp. UGAL515B_05]WON95959.1 alpha-L-fucosidase [Sphingobacterium sp. UGAL515B_05]
MKKNKSIIILMSAFLFQQGIVKGQWTDKREKPVVPIEVKFGAITKSNRMDPAMAAFRNYGLGQFIHWGLYAIPGNEWNGVSARQGAAASEWIRSWGGPTTPKNWIDIYDNLYKQFNPKNFDAKKWAKRAKEMGAKYVIFTTKHHDGFCLWPSKYSDYTIANSPYKKDIVKQVVDAYSEQGIDVYLYFSVEEWNNKDYVKEIPKTADEKARFDRFLKYTRNQLLELQANYPQIKGFWFDGTWDPSWINSYEFTYNLEKELRNNNPNLIIGSRFRNDEYESRHFDSNGVLLGDYEQGWERKMPASIDILGGNDWDCVMTIPPNGWGYIKNTDGMYLKTTDDVIDLLMRSRSMNGNFVLNFGPDENGNMSKYENELITDFGKWTKVNAEAIYEVNHFPLESKYGYYTISKTDANSLFLTVINKPINNILRLVFPKSANLTPASASLLNDKRDLLLKKTNIGFDRDKNIYFDITLPKSLKNKNAFVIKIKLDKSKIIENKLMDAKI